MKKKPEIGYFALASFRGGIDCYGRDYTVDKALKRCRQAVRNLRHRGLGYPLTQAAEEVAAIIEAVNDIRPLIKAACKQAVQAA